MGEDNDATQQNRTRTRTSELRRWVDQGRISIVSWLATVGILYDNNPHVKESTNHIRYEYAAIYLFTVSFIAICVSDRKNRLFNALNQKLERSRSSQSNLISGWKRGIFQMESLIIKGLSIPFALVVKTEAGKIPRFWPTKSEPFMKRSTLDCTSVSVVMLHSRASADC